MKIGVLAVQGAFIEHIHMLQELNVEAIEVRQKNDLVSDLDGIIIPGGESTVIGKLLDDLDMLEFLKEKISNGFPVFGTCAGLILLAKKIENPVEGQISIGTMNISVKRNAFGRQLGSFNTEDKFGSIENFPMVFIRAPYICDVVGNVEVLATVDGNIVAARQGNQLVTAFHPELTKDSRVHEYFLDEIVTGY